jgi:hypothetical protein
MAGRWSHWDRLRASCAAAATAAAALSDLGEVEAVLSDDFNAASQ